MEQNQEKKVEQNQGFDKYAKAKIEEPNLSLPKALLRVNTDPSRGEIYYIKILQADTKRVQHLAEAIAEGAQLDRKVYRIRNKELYKAAGENFKVLNEIQKVSKATIGVLGDGVSERHSQAFIDLVGTVEEVKMAEELIIDQILMTYTMPMFPVILMPPNIFGHEMRVPVDKLRRLTGKNNPIILGVEIVAGAWVQYDDCPPPGGQIWERTVRTYGPKPHVVKAVQLIHSKLYERGESIEAEKEISMLFKELTIGEREGMKPRTHDIYDQIYKLAVGNQKLQAGEGGSGSGQTGEQKEQKDVEEPEHEESKEETHQHEKDVEEVASGEASQQHVSDEEVVVSHK